MLTELRIRNFAIIEAVSLPLAPGLNVLTGETGAGKSIIVGALGVLLGDRASADLVRTGADRALVEGVFELPPREDILHAVDELGVAPEDGQLVLRREISAAGRARAWINDVSATATSLARIGRLLVNIHGQHEAQTLLDAEAQRIMLDAFGDAADAAGEVRAAHVRLAAALHDIRSLVQRRDQAIARADYLRHLAGEIESASLTPGEEERLEEEAGRLENADELRALASGAVHALEDEEAGALARLAAVQRALATAARMDASTAQHQEALDSAYYALQELARDLASYAQAVELDPRRLEEVRARRELVHRLTRKHGTTVDGLLDLARSARSELELLDTAGLDMRELERRRDAAHAELARAAERLTTLRRSAAVKLQRAVDPLLPSLGMPDGRIGVTLSPREEIGPSGAEDVEFRVALNVGHDPRPLARVASGGELSRVMLALKTVLARLDQTPTLIFDEVDAGIGGRVGLQVGDTMREVAAHHQVLAISHLPQIASRAHHHVVVAKSARGGVTAADVGLVDGEARVEEIARMLGGDPESELSKAHAVELLASVNSPERSKRAPSPRRSRKGRRG